MARKEKSIEELFWPKVIISGPDDCWLWSKAKNIQGYGRYKCKKKCYRAHRLSWELTNGPIPSGFIILHKCDNPSCVNPNHLFLGTYKDNTKDMLDKSRHVSGGRHTKLFVFLSPDQQRIEVTNLRAFADEMGMSHSTLKQLSRGRGTHIKGYRIIEKDGKPWETTWTDSR